VRARRPAAAIAAIAVALGLFSLSRAELPAAARGPAADPRHQAHAPPSLEVGEGALALRDGEPVDLNTANAAELALLPGVGPTLALRIVDFRSVEGPFTSVEGLTEVRGVGARTVERLREHVTVGR
jgi:competence protein ComEA